ncbi:hypothetical protein ANCDUO_22877 [Ancylostoma duodenale]|uniref:Endonuclease/exonuclease/phosphatase domain-containing protein n=1 Tax=Ancylostoma duodenale TaxID=51022 RepID=A0A0C2BT44_9BILA|nr:hypothetical protein ANCDUO_22877 [Ancylostoma duodenale]
MGERVDLDCCFARNAQNEWTHHLKQPAYQKLIIGDFNTQIGTRPANTRYVGKFAGKNWTEAGEILLDFAEQRRLYIANDFFQENEEKRWTYELSKVGNKKHEINYGLCSNILNRTFDTKIFEYRAETTSWAISAALTETYDEIQQKLMKILRATATKKQKLKRLPEETVKLLDRRRNTNRTENRIEYAELCKLIRRKMKEDHTNFRIQRLLRDRAPEPDGITNEIIKAGGYPLWEALATLFTRCFRKEDIPDQWKKSSTIIIPKEGDREDLNWERSVKGVKKDENG